MEPHGQSPWHRQARPGGGDTPLPHRLLHRRVAHGRRPWRNGGVGDLKVALRRLFPEGLRYGHHEAAGDDNGFSHLRAAFIGPSLTVPVVDGKLQLGTWQQIVLIDFDTRSRTRTFLIQILGT